METETYEIFHNGKAIKLELPEEIKSKIKKFLSEEVNRMKEKAQNKFEEFKKETRTMPDDLKIELTYILFSDRVRINIDAFAVSKYYGEKRVHYDFETKYYNSEKYVQQVNELGLQLRDFYSTIITLALEIAKTNTQQE